MTAAREPKPWPPPPGGVGPLRVAAIRAALVPVLVTAAQPVAAAGRAREGFPVVLSAFTAWAVVLLAAHLAEQRGRLLLPALLERAEPFVDLAAIVVLTYTSGGPFAPTAMALFVLPLLAAARLRPRPTAVWAAAAVGAYVALSLAHPALGAPHVGARILDQTAYLAWCGAAAVLLASALARRDTAVARLADERSRLAVHAVTAEQRERRRLAERLHDESIQTLSLAHQELLDFGRTGRQGSLERAQQAVRETIAGLRGQIFALYPDVVDGAGLTTALRALAKRFSAGMRGDITVTVDPAAAGEYDELLVVVARELLANAARHSGAAHVTVDVALGAQGVRLEVRDDGVGFAARDRADALRRGHIGLASSARRIRAAGGELAIESAPGRGTVARATLPVAASAGIGPAFAARRPS